MAQKGSRRVNLCISRGDETIMRWIDEQNCISDSIRDLIRQDCMERGYTDRFATADEKIDPRRIKPTREQRIRAADNAAVLARAIREGRVPPGIAAVMENYLEDDVPSREATYVRDEDASRGADLEPVDGSMPTQRQAPSASVAPRKQARTQGARPVGNRLMAGALADFTDLGEPAPSTEDEPAVAAPSSSATDYNNKLAAMLNGA